MRVTTVRSDGLAHLSYFVSSEGEAFVIDPRRDAGIYEQLCRESQCKITHVFETHRNEDYVTGSLEIQNLYPSARIGHSNLTAFKYGDDALSDGDSFRIGKTIVTALSTPGHTDDSMCYLAADSSVGKDPVAVFTGDTLFVNEVGRTDLVDPKLTDRMAEKLYKSLTEVLLRLDDGVIVYPAHGAGSVCGGDIGNREVSTIGFERRHNKWLRMDESEFVRAKSEQKLTLSAYFKRCERLNTVGPPLISTLETPSPMDVATFDSMMNQTGCVVIDTRPPQSFMRMHIPGSISIPLQGMGMSAGWVLSSEDRHLGVLARSEDVTQVWAYLLRVGLDSFAGYLASGIDEWKSGGRPTRSLHEYAVPETRSRHEAGTIKIIDVRQGHEYDKEHIQGTVSLPLSEFETGVMSLDKGSSFVTVCPSGVRSTTAASLLVRQGFRDVGVLAAGLKAWKSQGYPLTDK
ncbi:MAG: MBL fold metallo-hydrolase [Candidatus Thorarchaeota archaeon]|nr:MBL fold metallo-hydrolase [Candidatus Thorarchaeota archaeon]